MIVEGSTVPSISVSFPAMVLMVIGVSSLVVFDVSSTAVGGLLFTVNTAGGVDGVSYY